MVGQTKDHFSGHADAYARYRPEYPPVLFDYLAGVAPARDCAWDCGTGNGQAARALARRFRRVIATDLSRQQIQHARGPANVAFRVAQAECSGLDTDSVDLITVAQAFHWFDQARFFAEVRRVLRPGGVLALWAYGLIRISPPVDRLIRRFYAETVGPYWPPERAEVEAGYTGAQLPYPSLRPPSFTMTAQWSLAQVLGYLRTWSATQRYIKARGTDPTLALEPQLRRLWPGAGAQTVSWPLRLRVCRAPVDSKRDGA